MKTEADYFKFHVQIAPQLSAHTTLNSNKPFWALLNTYVIVLQHGKSF